MHLNLGKFVHTQNGKIIMSVILGFGLATLFRTMCDKKSCLEFYAPPLDEFKDKIYKNNGKCVKYNYVPTKCRSNAKVVEFE